MEKAFFAVLAGLCATGGMAVAQALAPAPPTGGAQLAKVAPTSTDMPACVEDCPPVCADRCVCGPPGRFWFSAGYLYWWTKDSRLPTLVTSGSAADAIPGAFGQRGTQSLFGGDVDSGGQSGARFEAGFWLDESQTIGLEGGYFFLGSHTNRFATGGSGATASSVITRPFLDIPPTGAAPFQDSEIVAFPGAAAGTIRIDSTTRLQGADGNGLYNLCCSDSCCGGKRFDLIGGFRWAELNEGVTINENIVPSANPRSPFPAGSRVAVTDQFSTQNDFYGPQIGVRGEWRRDRFFVNARGLVALGTTHEHMTINGMTVFTATGGAPTIASGGLLALPSNIGTYSRDVFSVVPEVGINVGYQVSPHLRAFAGYTFMYWSNVVRPGDVIDTGVNPSQLPTAAGRGPLVGAARPAFQFHDSSFWAQGINVGLEFRF